MDIQLFTKILKDKHFPDYKRLSHKYSAEFPEFLEDLQALYYKPLPLLDAAGEPLVFLNTGKTASAATMKTLLAFQHTAYGVKAAEEEIVATSAIENIDFSRDSVRNILKGQAPKDEQETRIAGLKKGIEFISDSQSHITEDNLFALYDMTIGKFLEAEDKLLPGNRYRHDAVFVVGSQVEHTGVDAAKVPTYMKNLVAFANAEDDIDDLTKAAILHFYVAYVHPYFDGNGRMARLLHLWFLIQKGYRSALSVPFSSCIERSRKAYYNAFSQAEDNRAYSDVLDVTPFILYCIGDVYAHMKPVAEAETTAVYEAALKAGQITKKQEELWRFVISVYGTDEFSTKQLERDFGNAAYATIRDFVLKFERIGLLTATTYSSRVKYQVNAK